MTTACFKATLLFVCFSKETHRISLIMPSLPRNPVTLGRDISLHPSPLKAPAASSPTVLVVGGGVTGLVTSWVLLDRGYHVTIISKEWATYTKNQRLTSQIAGALW